MRIPVRLIILLGCVISAGCQAESMDIAPFSTSLPVLPAQGETTQMTPSLPNPATSGLEILIEKAKEDLAQRLRIAKTQIRLVEAKEVVWPDSSIGCPQPGMLYKQVPYDGALIILQVEGKVYEYHNGGSRGLFLCEMVYKDPNTPPKLDVDILTPPTPDNSIPPGEDQ